MATFMTTFGLIWFIVSGLILVSIIYLMFFDDQKKKNDKENEELIKNTDPNSQLQTNITLHALNTNVLYLGLILISIFGFFFSSIIMYLYK
jgi:cbb3-type cytochrome oxidase subunit 3